MKDNEIAESVKWEAEQQIPFDVNSIELDYAVVNRDRADGKIDVLLVAAKKDAVIQKVDLLHEAGLEVKRWMFPVLQRIIFSNTTTKR